MKKKVLLLLVVALCMTAFTTGTLAYFTGEDTAHNVITTGGVNIAIVEKQAVQGEDGTTEIDFPKNGITGVMPGTTVSKIVKVQNTGASEAWIRVKVDARITSAPTEQNPNGTALNTSVMEYDIQSNDWENKDGYYYYKQPVASGELTAALFNAVTFSKDMDNTYQNCTANIEIYAQAVQTANNGATVLEAKGWPGEDTPVVPETPDEEAE